ncbi:serine hydrolase [Microbacterium sp. NPDC087589]|uniref:serine hydrolase n=1 Tax=Microbacterium sp. NPDC087589 TaxID=3364191 RepID=UPI00380C3CA3
MRRRLCLTLGCLLTVAALTGCAATNSGPSASTAASPAGTPTAAAPSPDLDSVVEEDLIGLEQEYDATIGVVAVDTATGESVSYGGDRRFGFASTIKAFAAAEFLRSVHGSDRDELVRWTAAEADAAGHAPVTSQHVEDGLTYAQLAEAAVRSSDNAALNRAGAPDGWAVADKSGGAGAIRNDIALVTPPERDPIIITVLTSRNDPEAAFDDALVARTASVVLNALERS